MLPFVFAVFCDTAPLTLLSPNIHIQILHTDLYIFP